jgi:hypothetical protein
VSAEEGRDAALFFFECEKQVATARGAEQGLPAITTAGNEMKVSGAVATG